MRLAPLRGICLAFNTWAAHLHCRDPNSFATAKSGPNSTNSSRTQSRQVPIICP